MTHIVNAVTMRLMTHIMRQCICANFDGKYKILNKYRVSKIEFFFYLFMCVCVTIFDNVVFIRGGKKLKFTYENLQLLYIDLHAF